MTDRRPRLLWLLALLVPVVAVDVWLHLREKPKSAPPVTANTSEASPVAASREPSPPEPPPAPAMPALAVRGPEPSPPRAQQPAAPILPQPVMPAVHEERGSNGDEPPVVTLAQVGDIALGVRKDPRLLEIRDEARLKQVLERVGHALEDRVRQHPEEGSAELVERLADYREELGQYMRGDVQIRGPGWTIETETGPALPQEKWWTPRP